MIQVGSNYFFNSIDGFIPKDKDFLILQDETKFEFYMQKRLNNVDYFYWNKRNIFKYNYNKQPMAVGKFLIPDVLVELNVTFEDVLPLLEEFIPKLDEKHTYQSMILQFYKENNEMSLTTEQRLLVFDKYKY